MPQMLLITLMVCAVHMHAQVNCGIDNIIDTDFAMFKGQRIALVTHAAARSNSGRSTAEEFLRRQDVTVRRILAPEHGYFGVVPAGAAVLTDTILDSVIVRSLYGDVRRPTQAMLTDVDAVVFDLQDIGVRSYTYLSTMIEVMEACALAHRPLYVLDRPNPLGGDLVDGSIIEDSLRSFVGRIPVPYIHGCTLGELADMANREGWVTDDSTGIALQCSLIVVKCKRWQRTMTWEETGRSWYPTSPNIPSVAAIRGYAVTGLAGELGLLSIGIGTATPFTVIGAPEWAGDPILVSRMASCGVGLAYARYQPAVGKYARQRCSGYYLSFERGSFRPYKAAMMLLHTLAERHGALYADTLATTSRARMFAKTSGHGDLLGMLLRRSPWRDVEALASAGLDDFRKRREPYLLYR